MKYAFIILTFCLTFHSLESKEMPKLDPEKFTVCSITINSDNEKKIFEEEVTKSSAFINPIVELTDFGGSDWFEKACHSKIQCDQLLISGHFGGTFFGSTGYSLSLNELEKMGCSKKCEGILSDPYEIFLMGCNTLASKERDHRTPEVYLNVLLEDGISRHDAELIVESRYGVTGDSTSNRMQRAFSGERKQLYGFDSVGPSGTRVEGFLKKYFKKRSLKDRMDESLAKRAMSKVSLLNRDLENLLRHSAFTQCETGGGKESAESLIICGLRDEKSSIERKISYIREALSANNYLTYIPAINDFFASHPISTLSFKNRKAILDLRKNSAIKNKINLLINHTKSLSLLLDWLQLGKNLGVIDENSLIKTLSSQINSMFADGITTQEKDTLCSLSSVSLRKRVLLEEKYIFSKLEDPDTKRALLCIAGPKISEQLQLALVKEMDKEIARDQRLTYAYIFSQIKPRSTPVLMALLDEMRPLEDYSASLIILLRNNVPKDPKVQLKILDGFYSSEVDRYVILELIRRSNPVSREVLKKIDEIDDQMQYLKRGSTIMGRIQSLLPPTKEVQLRLIERSQKLPVGVKRLEIFQQLRDSGVKDKSVFIELAKLLKSEDWQNRTIIAEIFYDTMPRDREILDILKDSSLSLWHVLSEEVD